MNKHNFQLYSFFSSSSPSKPLSLYTMACIPNNEWILDLGDSYHMANDRIFFLTLITPLNALFSMIVVH